MPTPTYVVNEDPLFFSVQYSDHGDPVKRGALQTGWQVFDRLDPATQETYRIWTRPSNDTVEVTVDRLLPPGTPAGYYRLETFVPARHATTRKAVFTIVTNAQPPDGGREKLDEALVLLDMLDLNDVWCSLGEFYLDPTIHPLIGRVRQVDLSREDPPRLVAFGPVRWVPLSMPIGDDYLFDSPVGTAEERAGPFPTGRMMFGRYPAWAGDWFDVNPFLSWYTYGCHTGADLNLPGASGADKGKPIYAIASGRVTYAGRAGTWGNIIVIEHPEGLVTYPDGHTERQKVYSRYGHVENNILVQTGQDVSRGDNIGFIGLAAGATAGWHLHFDICYSEMLKNRPSHWPNLDGVRGGQGVSRNSENYQRAQSSVVRQVLAHYVDPLRFIRDNHRPT